MNEFELILLDLRDDEIPRHDWGDLSKSDRVRLAFIDEHIDRFPWKQYTILTRNDLTIDFIIKHHHLYHSRKNRAGYDAYHMLCINDSISADDIWKLANLDFPEFPADVFGRVNLLDYKPMTLEQIQKYIDDITQLPYAARRTTEPEKFLATYPDLLLSLACNPEITESISRKIIYEEKNVLMTAGHRLPIQFIRESKIKYPRIIWINLELHPDATVDDMLDIGYLFERPFVRIFHFITMFKTHSSLNNLACHCPNITIEYALLHSKTAHITNELLISCIRFGLITSDLYDIYMTSVSGDFRGDLQDLTLDYFRKYRDVICL